MPDYPESSSWKTTPGFAKALILTQTAVISFFSFWFYQEYLNNQYLQAYMSTTLQGTSLAILALTAAAVIASTTIALFLRLRKTPREVLLTSENTPETHRTLGLIDNRTEAHLIDMIRRSGPMQETPKNTAMPQLRQREEPDTKASQSKLP